MSNFINILAEETTSGKPFEILLPLALIIIVAKILSLICRKIGIPAVVGYLLSGVILGLFTFIPNQILFTPFTMEGINDLAKIGVVLIMFGAGMGTDLKKIKETGVSSIVVTSLGVIFPLVFGAGLAFACFGYENTQDIWTNIFYGILLTATSISITVTVLKELGKLNTKVGACIESAAILDDIIGIVLLSIVLSLSGTSSTDGNVTSNLPFGITTNNSGLDIFLLIVFVIAFFALCIALWWPVRKLFKWLNDKWPMHRRIPIFGFGLAFLLAYVAEKCFGVADITGAFMAGLMLSGLKSQDYLDHKLESETGIIFAPVFFASIGLMLFTEEMNFTDPMIILFGFLFIIFGLLGKLIGAGFGGILTRFKFRQSLIIGVGMMARAEVIIVTAQKGIDAGIISIEIMPFIILLIVISSLITPILLKLLYRNYNDPEEISTINRQEEK